MIRAWVTNSVGANYRIRERGVTLLIVALSILLLMTMAALAVDVGILYTSRTSAQHAADAAALAGAYSFLNESQPQPASATNAAIAAAAKDSVMGTPVTITASDVVVDTTLRRVTVTVRRTVGSNPINTFFAGAIGISKMGTEARAVAEASTLAIGSRCVKPVYIPNTVLTSLPTSAAACAANPKQVIFDSAGNVTAWAKAKLGGTINLHQNLEPSQYYSLDFGNGGSSLRCTWGHCLTDPSCSVDITVVKCGQSYPVETGNKAGPVKQGVDDLLGSPADTFVGLDQYKDNSTGRVSDTSKSLVVSPVWDNCSQTIKQGKNGQTVKVVGFAKVFVDSVSGGGNNQAINGHLISELQCDKNAGNTASTGPYAVPIRLVQVPAS